MSRAGQTVLHGGQARSWAAAPQESDTDDTVAVRPPTKVACLPDLVSAQHRTNLSVGQPRGGFGYADDTAILCTGQSLDETSNKASDYVQELVNWGAANGISFDPEKTEATHFLLKTRGTTLPIRHGDVVKHPKAAMRWLGNWGRASL